MFQNRHCVRVGVTPDMGHHRQRLHRRKSHLRGATNSVRYIELLSDNH